MIFGTLINTGAIILGGSIGLLLKGKIPEKFSSNVIRIIGLCVCIIGITGAIKGDVLLIVASITLGYIVGELARIEGGLNKLGLWLQRKLSRNEEKNSAFSEGFVTATLLFCVGAMAIVGSIESGVNSDLSIIITKSIMDGITSLILASTFGFGVLLSAIFVFIYQGAIELFAINMQGVFTEGLVTQISAVGGLMILAIGLNMVLNLNPKIRTANLLPGFLFAVGYYFLFLV